MKAVDKNQCGDSAVLQCSLMIHAHLPSVSIHLYQVSSTDEITQASNKIMIASLIDAGVSFSGPPLTIYPNAPGTP